MAGANYMGGKRNAAKARSKDRNSRAQRGHFTRQRLEIFSKISGKPNPNLPSDKSSAINIDLAHAQKDILSGRIKHMTQAHAVRSNFLQSSSIPNARTLSSVPADSNHNNCSPRVLQAWDTIDFIHTNTRSRVLMASNLAGLPMRAGMNHSNTLQKPSRWSRDATKVGSLPCDTKTAQIRGKAGSSDITPPQTILPSRQQVSDRLSPDPGSKQGSTERFDLFSGTDDRDKENILNEDCSLVGSRSSPVSEYPANQPLDHVALDVYEDTDELELDHSQVNAAWLSTHTHGTRTDASSDNSVMPYPPSPPHPRFSSFSSMESPNSKDTDLSNSSKKSTNIPTSISDPLFGLERRNTGSIKEAISSCPSSPTHPYPFVIEGAAQSPGSYHASSRASPSSSSSKTCDVPSAPEDTFCFGRLLEDPDPWNAIGKILDLPPLDSSDENLKALVLGSPFAVFKADSRHGVGWSSPSRGLGYQVDDGKSEILMGEDGAFESLDINMDMEEGHASPAGQSNDGQSSSSLPRTTSSPSTSQIMHSIALTANVPVQPFQSDTDTRSMRSDLFIDISGFDLDSVLHSPVARRISPDTKPLSSFPHSNPSHGIPASISNVPMRDVDEAVLEGPCLFWDNPEDDSQ